MSNPCDMTGMPIEFVRREVSGEYALWTYDENSEQFIVHGRYETELAARLILEARAFGSYTTSNI